MSTGVDGLGKDVGLGRDSLTAVVCGNVRGVARAVLALSVAVGLMGCNEIPQEAQFTDADGCDWKIKYTVNQIGADLVRFDSVAPRLDKAGKPMCGAP